jgi:hypothetical protein
MALHDHVALTSLSVVAVCDTHSPSEDTCGKHDAFELVNEVRFIRFRVLVWIRCFRDLPLALSCCFRRTAQVRR